MGQRPASSVLRLVHRAKWNFIDQALTALSNAGLSILVARQVDANAFGVFALAFAIFSFAVGLSRSMMTDPLMVRYAKAGEAEFAEGAGHATGSGLMISLFTSAALLIAAPVFGLRGNSGLATAFAVLAVVLPVLLVHDAMRGSLLARRLSARVVVVDGTWALVQFLLAAVVIVTGHASTAAFMLAWGAGSLCAIVVALRLGASAPAVRGAFAWLMSMRDLSGYYSVQYVASMGAYQFAIFLVGAIGSVAAVGTLRAAQVLLGPINILISGTVMFALPELSRRSSPGRATDVKASLAISGGLVAAVIAWGGVLLLLPDSVGKVLLGDTWAQGRVVLPASIVSLAAVCATIGPGSVLRSHARARIVFRLTLIVAPLLFLGGVLGVSLDGAEGAAVGFAVAQVVVVPFWWLVVLRAHRDLAVESTPAVEPLTQP